jgi:hypothetical protein
MVALVLVRSSDGVYGYNLIASIPQAYFSGGIPAIIRFSFWSAMCVEKVSFTELNDVWYGSVKVKCIDVSYVSIEA